jgi:hypothetical protein
MSAAHEQSDAMEEAEVCALLEQALLDVGATHDLRRDVFPMLRDGRAQWWQRGKGVIITEIHTFPNCRMVHYWLAAGRLADVLALQPEIDAWAIAEGCDAKSLIGRRGWEKVLPAHGWMHAGAAMVAPLESGGAK